MSTYFGFAIADGMFPSATIIKRELTPEKAKAIIDDGITSCCNPSHVATIEAARVRYGIVAPVPEKPPLVKLVPGDSIIVMGVRGLPRLTDRHEYTAEEIAGATFSFSQYTLVSVSTGGGDINLYRYEDAQHLRLATPDEVEQSALAAERDGGVGAITVEIDGESVTCYVAE